MVPYAIVVSFLAIFFYFIIKVIAAGNSGEKKVLFCSKNPNKKCLNINLMNHFFCTLLTEFISIFFFFFQRGEKFLLEEEGAEGALYKKISKLHPLSYAGLAGVFDSPSFNFTKNF